MAHMVGKKNGRYRLDGMSGDYAFSQEQGQCAGRLEADGKPIGTFSWEPIRKEGGPLEIPAGDRELPCISVEVSEIMAEIQKPSSDGAMFVLPSQLNGAEYMSHDDRSIVREIDEYKRDNTGGPRGQLAVHPAAGQFVLDNASNTRNRSGLNAVDGIEKATRSLFSLQNGYLALPENGNDEAVAAFRDNLGSMRIIATQDVPACGLKPNKRELNRDAGHKVSVVYASAIPVNTYLNRVRLGDKKAEEFQRQVAELDLVAQYYGSLKLAAARGCPAKVFLMPLGGGVFGNPWECIASAMSKAAEMLTDAERQRLDIRALAWSGNPSEAEVLRELLTEFKKLKPDE